MAAPLGADSHITYLGPSLLPICDLNSILDSLVGARSPETLLEFLTIDLDAEVAEYRFCLQYLIAVNRSKRGFYLES